MTTESISFWHGWWQVCERELCQVLTQGTLVDEALLGTPQVTVELLSTLPRQALLTAWSCADTYVRCGEQANYLLSVTAGGRAGGEFGVCLLEASTGVFYIGQVCNCHRSSDRL